MILTVLGHSDLVRSILFHYLLHKKKSIFTQLFFLLGTRVGSRFEYSSFPFRSKTKFDFSLEFKTNYPDGVLLYVCGARHIDFVALYIKDGKVNGGFLSKV